MKFHSPSSKRGSGSSEGAGEGGGGTKLERGTPWVKESRHMESKYRAARVLELLALGLRVWASWSRVLLNGVLRTQVAPTPEGRRRVLMIFCGLASGESLHLRRESKGAMQGFCAQIDLGYETVAMLGIEIIEFYLIDSGVSCPTQAGATKLTEESGWMDTKPADKSASLCFICSGR